MGCSCAAMSSSECSVVEAMVITIGVNRMTMLDVTVDRILMRNRMEPMK